MNKLIVLALLASFSAYAEDCTEKTGQTVTDEVQVINTNVPSHLKGAVIIVRRADGKETTVPAEKFKVVPRKQQFIAKSKVRTDTLTCRNDQKNRISLLGGYGSKPGLNSSTNGTTTEVESKTGLVGGAQYQRKVGDKLSVGVQGQTNKSGAVLLGIDF